MNYDYNYNYNYNYDLGSANATGIFGLIAGLGTMFLIISLVISILVLVSMWKIFKKAGKGGWEILIPIYNTIVLLQVAGLPAWYIILYIIPFVNIYVLFKVNIELAKKFQMGTGFGILAVFFPIICYPILAFSKSAVYLKDEREPESSILDVETNGVTSDQEFNYGYEKEDTVAISPVSLDENTVSEAVSEEKNLQNTSSEEVTSETTSEPTSETISNEEVKEENIVDRFHTSSKLDEKDNNE